MEPIKAERVTVKFFEGLEVEGYKMPDGEFRVGLSGASRVLGYSTRWLARVVSGESRRTAQALQGLGFTENVEKVVAQSNQGNPFEDRTISLSDFNSCIIYAVQNKKKAAIALSQAFTKLALIDFFRDAFKELPLTIEEKRRLFYETYAATISPEDWRKMDREEILRLALPGDEPQLKDWNR